jgi:monoamine oxidase
LRTVGGEEYLALHSIVVAIPPQLCAQISFEPPLPPAQRIAMEQTPTWMSGASKVFFSCVLDDETTENLRNRLPIGLSRG